jgi:tetratricopeptide (TPR) repeat protein
MNLLYSFRNIGAACVVLLLASQPSLVMCQSARSSPKSENHLLRGQAFLEKDQNEEALKELHQAVALDPDRAESRFQFGLAQWKLGRLPEAGASFEKTLQLKPDHPLAAYYLGRIALQNGDTTRAVAHLKQVIEFGRGKAVQDEYFQLGKTLLGLGKFEEAIPVLESGIQLQPRDHRLYAQLGRAYRSAGRRQDAERSLAKSNELRDYQREATRLLLEASEHLKVGAADKAEAIYQRMVDSKDVDDLVSLGISFVQHKLHVQAVELLSRALRLSPDLFEAHYNLGLALLRHGDQQQAEKHLVSAAALRPYSFEVNSVLGVVLSQKGATDDAIRALRRAEALKPDDLKVATLLALQLIEGRYYSEALNLLEGSMKRFPKNLDLRLLYIQTCHRDQKYEKAVQAAEQTVARFPESARANFEMGYQLLSFGRFQQARSFLENAVRLDPSLADGYASLGEVVAKEGRSQEAIRYFREALQREPAHLEAYLGLAKALLSLKKYREVIAEMAKAVEIDPINPQPHFHLSQAFLALGEKDKAEQEAETFRKLNQARMARRDQEGGREFPSQ